MTKEQEEYQNWIDCCYCVHFFDDNEFCDCCPQDIRKHPNQGVGSDPIGQTGKSDTIRIDLPPSKSYCTPFTS